MEPTSPPISGFELLAATATGLIVAAAANLPLLAHVTTHVPVALADPLLQAWQVAWNGHALVHQPTGIFDTNAFWPLNDTLAFSDALLGYAPVGLIGSGISAAIVRYDVLHVLATALTFVATYLLSRELGAGPLAAAVAGVAYSFAPWRFSQANHLNILSSGGIPLSLFLLARGVRLERPTLVASGSLVAAWQVSLGFVLGLPFLYLLAFLGTALAIVSMRRRHSIAPRVVVAGAVGAIAIVTVAAALAVPYARVGSRHPESTRTVSEVRFFSTPPRGFLVAPEGNLVWGALTRSSREALSWPNEQTAFPGISISGLALLGLLWSRAAPFTIRLGLAVVAGVAATLCLGFRLADGAFGYRLLYEHLPGWDRIRVPGRLMVFVTIGLALLAGLGAQHLIQGRARGRGTVVASVLIALVVVEGVGALEIRRVPRPVAPVGSFEEPQLHLPMDAPHVIMLWSTDGFPIIVNGHSGIVPELTQRTIEATLSFPDPASISYLSRLGVRSVVFHRRLAPGTLWEGVPDRPIDGLNVCATIGAELVVYELGPDPSTC